MGIQADRIEPWTAALIEREGPLEQLRTAFSKAALGEGSMIVVAGEAGLGKTALLEAFAAQVSCERVLWGGCEALGTSLPLGPIYDMAPALGADLFRLLEDPQHAGRFMAALLEMIQASRKPILMVIEDVHWADQATLDLIKFLGRRARFLRLQLVISHRPGEAAERISELLGDIGANLYEVIRLAPLSPRAVGSMPGASRLSVTELYRVTGGNPFFVTELLATPVDTSEPLPQSVRDAVWARAAKLGPRTCKLLELLSIMPTGASWALLERMLDARDMRALDACLIDGLLVSGDGGVRFRHELARNAMMARLSAAGLRALHRKAMGFLEGLDGGDDPTIVGLRLHHAELAGDRDMVLRLAPVAAAHAARLGAHREAAAYLGKALPLLGDETSERAATLYEDWSYEAGLAHRIDDEVLAARRKAIALWQALGRTDRVGRNLRWLSRLYWYRGEGDRAEELLNQAIATLETVDSGADLAMSYSMRSQWHMLNDRIEPAIAWGRRAVELARGLGEVETQVHALNNIGSAMMAAGDMSGRAELDQSLELALAHGYHEHAARVYTNMTETAALNRDFLLAEEYCDAGIAFDTVHDLDSWLYYLHGCRARLAFERGRYAMAEAIARHVLDRRDLTLIMHLTAATVLGRLYVRQGNPDGPAMLEAALRDAERTREPQRIVPVRLALAEAAWIAGDHDRTIDQVRAIAAVAPDHYHRWELGEAAVWGLRAGSPHLISGGWENTAWALEAAGEAEQAAAQWTRLGMPFEAALALAQDRGAARRKSIEGAIAALEKLDATAAAARVRSDRRSGPAGTTTAARGPYRAARSHPAGLTAKEQQVLALMADGAGNARIAAMLNRSPRTIEHHVSSILLKLGAANRLEVLLRVQREPWLLGE